jgi:hypothetical protein
MRRLSLALLLLLIGALAPSAAQAAPPAVCPTVKPTDELVVDSHATGWTVERGNTIDSFEVTVLGVLEDGIAPGVDMIIVETESPALERAHGIWAGMSGSPVYADDGRLIGAVAYGLSFGPSKLGGLAAAGDMTNVLNRTDTASASAVKLPASLQKKMVATGEATAREAASGLQRLRTPLAVSGLNSKRLSAFADRLPGHENFIPYAAGAAAPATGDPSAIVPGGNFAAAISYGDITAGGVGTTTIVCNGRAVAFGHPFNFDGPSALSAHNATAITVQDDPTLAPFKLANIGGTVGTLDQDRLSGIRAVLGDAPDPIEVTSDVNDDPDEELTNVNRTRDVPNIAAFHLLANIDGAFDRVGGGRTEVGWTVRGKAGGKQFSLTRNNKFADLFDVSFITPDEMFLMLQTLVDNPFSEVTFDDVKIDATVQAPFVAYRITGVEQRVGAGWEPLDGNEPLPLQPGATVRLRVLLARDRSTAAIPPVELTLKVPADAAGRDGSIDVTGGGDGGGGEEGSGSGDEPKSFDELLASLRNAPQNDQVVASLNLFTGEESSPSASTDRKTVAEIVSGGVSIPVVVPSGEEPPPCEVPPCEEPPLGSPPSLNVGGKSTFKLATALRRGIKLTARSSEAGRVTLKAFVDRKTARRLKLKKNAKGPVVVAAASKRIHAGRNAVKLVFTKKARKRLRHAGRVKLAVRATIRSLEGNVGTDRFKLTLRRKLR